MKNIKINYLYRDASNYSNHASVIFSNSEELDLDEIEKRIMEKLIDENWFVAEKVRIPEVFLFYDYDFNEEDHFWHEYNFIEETNKEANDEWGRSISEFINELSLMIETEKCI